MGEAVISIILNKNQRNRAIFLTFLTKRSFESTNMDKVQVRTKLA